jgi:hypothetical protein
MLVEIGTVKIEEIIYFYEALLFVHTNKVKYVLSLTFIEIKKRTHP